MKFFSKPVAEHQEVPLADEGRLEQAVAHWHRRHDQYFLTDNPTYSVEHQERKSGVSHHVVTNNCYVVSVSEPGMLYPEGALNEILGLVKAQGDVINGFEMCRLSQINPKTYLSKGLAKAIAERVHRYQANMLVIDADLTPSQLRNLEHLIGIAVCDREAVILNVFLCHAKTRQAKIQVEKAQLEYLRPRIRGLGIDMDQQAGGIMRGKGAGETASELMARRLDGRMAQLQKASKKINRAAEGRRKNRMDCHRIALVGYTNAGKTSVMNALTHAGLSARDLPFETLDTTTRRLKPSDSLFKEELLLSDTVGFIRHLPQRLMASFESTLAEIVEANLLLLVVDISDPEMELQLATTETILTRLKAHRIPRFYVFNKRDKLDQKPASRYLERLCRGYPFLLLSCREPESTGELNQALAKQLCEPLQTHKVFVPYQATELLKQIYAHCRVLDSQSDTDGLHMRLTGKKRWIERIQQHCHDMAKTWPRHFLEEYRQEEHYQDENNQESKNGQKTK